MNWLFNQFTINKHCFLINLYLLNELLAYNLDIEEHFFIQRIIAANKIAGLTTFIEIVDFFDHIYDPFWKNKKSNYSFKQIFEKMQY